MATFAELVQEVYTITNRPDLVNETALAVKAATLKMHHSDFYAKDLFETGIQWATPAYLQSLEYRVLVPRFRQIKFLRKFYVDALGQRPGPFFTILTPDQIVDSYGLDKVNVAYTAGQMLEIKSDTQDSYMLFGCYLHPDVTVEKFNSWVALDHPYAIVFEAARVLFKQIGYDEQAASYEKLVAEQVAELKLSNLATVGE